MQLPGSIFLDKQDIEKTERAIMADKGEGTVDELGFGVVYDQISEDLFPWCSTLTTRALYFFSSIAILKLAAEYTADKFANQINSDDKHPGKELRGKINDEFYRNVERFEVTLALALFFKDQPKNGLFGKRNITSLAKNWSPKRFMDKGILSLMSRYPNKIYRGAIKSLGAFESDDIEDYNIMNGTLHDVISSKTLFNSKWEEASDPIYKDIKNLYEFIMTRRVGGSQGKGDFLKDIPLNELEEEFKKGLDEFDFDGFKLGTTQKALLKKLMEKKTPYLKEIENILKQRKDLKLSLIYNELSNSSEYKPKFKSAIDIDLVTSPFRELYIKIKKSQHVKVNTPIVNQLKYKEFRNVYFNLKNQSYYSISPVEKFLDKAFDILDKSKGNINVDLINHIKARAEEVVSSRRKLAPHLSNKKKKVDKDVLDDIGDIRESSFRSWNASVILKDIY